MKVECQIEEVELENESGRLVDGVVATCSRCDHETESFGTGEKSRKRCLVLMKEECPNNEENYYVDRDDDGFSEPPPSPRKPWWEKT